jgi:hypothetical protein
MSDSPEKISPLKPQDAVYVKSLGLFGEVVEEIPATKDEPADLKMYEVRVTKNPLVERTDLELYDREAEHKRWEQESKETFERRAKVAAKITALPPGSAPDPQLFKEFLDAFGDFFTRTGTLRRRA